MTTQERPSYRETDLAGYDKCPICHETIHESWLSCPAVEEVAWHPDGSVKKIKKRLSAWV